MYNTREGGQRADRKKELRGNQCEHNERRQYIFVGRIINKVRKRD